MRTRVRGNLGAVTALDWNPVNGWEWGTVLPDPLDPNTVYATGNGVIRISYPSEQWVNVSPAQDPSLPAAREQRRADVVRRRGIHTRCSPAFSTSCRRRTAACTGRRSARTSAIRANFTLLRPADAASRATPSAARSVDRRFDRRARHDLGGHQHGSGEGHARQRPDVDRRVRTSKAPRQDLTRWNRRTRMPPRRT